MKLFYKVFVALSLLFVSSSASADYPRPWQIYFQDAASPVMERLENFHDGLMVFVVATSAFVLFLLVYVCIRFSAKNNPVPSKTTHNTLLEVVWTAVPVIILVIMTIPSIRMLYYIGDVKESDMTIKMTGYQWYWGYQYVDNGGFFFESRMIPDGELKEGDIRLLAVDNEVVLPVDTKIRIQLSSADVIHALAVPALGLKQDAVPGRLNETWVEISKPGTYYGQCSELCGVNHGFMPIKFRAVSKEEFKEWVIEAQAKFAGVPDSRNFASLGSE